MYLGVAEGGIFLLGAAQTAGRIVQIGRVTDFAVKISACDQGIPVDARGNPLLPIGAFEEEPPEDVDEDMGSIASLYPDHNTTTDAFYAKLPCDPSIGGTLPPEEPQPPGVDEANEALGKFESAYAGPDNIASLVASTTNSFPPFQAINKSDCFLQTESTASSPATRVQIDCDSDKFLNSSMPFEGRDIIYVHGLNTTHLKDRIMDPTGPAGGIWPTNATEFLNPGGYFRARAEAYWTPHIVEHLSSPSANSNGDPWPNAGWQWTDADANPLYLPKSNRYLLVAWNTSQRLADAQHAMLDQIQRAIASNTNVVTPPTYPAGQIRPFCSNGCIVISHSTGGLLVSTALSRAYAGDFGPGGTEIASRMKAHVALNGAISGSRIASAAIMLALLGTPAAVTANAICEGVDWLTGGSNSCNADLSFLLSSVLVDLVPGVAQGMWGDVIDESPIPTVTVAGGHPLGNQALGLTKLLLPGLDDTVVTMNSACGNPNPVVYGLVPPSGLSVLQPVKAFEFSNWLPRLVRGTKMWLSHKNLQFIVPIPGYLSGACTPHLSPQGMVLPVASAWTGTNLDTRKRYRNHYSFIQGVAEHSYDGGASPAPALWPSYTGGPASELRQYEPRNALATTAVSGINVEESVAVTDAGIYSVMLDSNGTKLVKPVGMREVVRGKRIRFHMPFNIGNCVKKPGAFPKFYCTRWIWKRTYHLADKWEQKQSSHYVYEFVGRR